MPGENNMLSQLPNPIASPPWLQLVRWITDPIALQVESLQKYGDIFTMQLGGLGSYVVVGNPQAIQEIFSQDAKQFDVGIGNTLAIPLLGQNSILLMDGDRHRRERKLLMPPFHGERLQTYAKQICSIAEQVASQWQKGQFVTARSAMQAISLEVILQIVFGLSKGERYSKLKSLLVEWTNMTDSPVRSSMLFFQFLQRDWGSWSPWGRMKQRQRQIHELLQAEIEERRSKGDVSTDILSLMMAARDENGQPMTDEELRDELLTILFAGHETTATSIAWAFYQIHQQPHIREKLLYELSGLGENPDPLAIAQLPYLNTICQETLRMYPVIPATFARITKSPIKIGG
jgi:cytochrome P450 family 110